MSDMLLAALRALQQAGVSVDAEGALDAVWLALRTRGTSWGTAAAESETGGQVQGGGSRATSGAGDTAAAAAAAPSPTSATTAGSTPPVAPDGIPRHTEEFAVPLAALSDAEQAEARRMRLLHLERVAALPMGLALSRALRPLRRRSRAPGVGRLDVDATVRRLLDERIFVPSYLPARERWLDLVVVLDRGLSMIVWKEALDELTRLLATAGTFRSVTPVWLTTDGEALELRTQRQALAVKDHAHLARLVPTPARAVALVVSDCVSAAWHDGRVARAVSRWSEQLPVVLTQVTPHWFWPRTALGEALEQPVAARAALTRNAQLVWDREAAGLGSLSPDESAASLLPVPVATLSPDGIGRLARLLSGAGDAWTPGAIFDLEWDGAPPPHAPAALSATERVARFHTLASAGARRLAAAFASSPIQSLGMLRLLRRDLLGGSTQFAEAEVLLGGIVRVRRESASWEAGATLPLEFLDGVQALLQDSAAGADVVRVLQHASAMAGLGARQSFDAWLSAPEAEALQLEGVDAAFAAAAAPVLQRLGGAYARAAVRPARAPSSDATNTDTARAEAALQRSHRLEPPVPFVGRKRELADLMAWSTMTLEGLFFASIRCVMGAPGIGKRALAAAFMREWNARFADDPAFYWSFALDESTDACERAMVDFFGRGRVETGDDVDVRPALERIMSQRERVLVVLHYPEGFDHRESRWLPDLCQMLTEHHPGHRVLLVGRQWIYSEWPAEALTLEPLAPAHVEEWVRQALGDVMSPEARSADAMAETRELLLALSGGVPAVLQALVGELKKGSILADVRDVFLGSGEPRALSLTELREGESVLAGYRDVRDALATAAANRRDGKLQEAVALASYAQEVARRLSWGGAEQLGLIADGLLLRASLQLETGNLEVAEADAVDARRLLGSLGRGGDWAEASCILAEVHLRRERFSEAMEVASDVLSDRVLAAGQDWSKRFAPTLAARAHRARTDALLRMGERARALTEATEGLRLAESAGDAALSESLHQLLVRAQREGADDVREVTFTVFGRVAGVGYRTFVDRVARELGLEGDAENRRDGTIVVRARGTAEALDALERRLRVGPPGAKVSRVLRSDREEAVAEEGNVANVAPEWTDIPAASEPHGTTPPSPFPAGTIFDLCDVRGSAWAAIDACTFDMGCPDGDPRERPVHRVSLSAFSIARTPVTNSQWEAYLNETNGEVPSHWFGGAVTPGTEHHPIVNVTWDAANAFCRWLTEHWGAATGGRFALPTEAQWERAAKGTEERTYPWGEDRPTPALANFGARLTRTTPVDAHPSGATPDGILDLAGNAWEWCHDLYGDYGKQRQKDPTGATKGNARVTRGGSFRSEADRLRCTYRQSRHQHRTSERAGFRVVWMADPRETPIVQS